MPRFFSILIIISHLCVFAHASDENIALLSESGQTTLHSGPGGLALFGETQHNRVHHNTKRLVSFFIPLIDNQLDHLWWDTGTVLLDSRLGYRKVIDTPLLDQYWFWGVHGGWNFYTTLKKPDDKGASYYLKHAGVEIAGSCWGQLTVNFYRVFDDFPQISDTTDFKRREHLNFLETSTIQAEFMTCLDAQGVSAKITPLLFKNLKISALLSYSELWTKGHTRFTKKKAYRFGISGEYALSSQVSVQGQYLVFDTHCKDKDLWSVGIRFCGNGSYLSNDLFQGRLKRPAEVDIPQYFKYHFISKETDTDSSIHLKESKPKSSQDDAPEEQKTPRRATSRAPSSTREGHRQDKREVLPPARDRNTGSKDNKSGFFSRFRGSRNADKKDKNQAPQSRGSSERRQSSGLKKNKKHTPTETYYSTDNDSLTEEEVIVEQESVNRKIGSTKASSKSGRAQSADPQGNVSKKSFSTSNRRSPSGNGYTPAYDHAWERHQTRWEEEAMRSERAFQERRKSAGGKPSDDYRYSDDWRVPFSTYANKGGSAHYSQQTSSNFDYAGAPHQRHYPKQPEYTQPFMSNSYGYFPEDHIYDDPRQYASTFAGKQPENAQSYWYNGAFYYWYNGVFYSNIGRAPESAAKKTEWRDQEAANSYASPKKPKPQSSHKSMHSAYETAEEEFYTPRKPPYAHDQTSSYASRPSKEQRPDEGFHDIGPGDRASSRGRTATPKGGSSSNMRGSQGSPYASERRSRSSHTRSHTHPKHGASTPCLDEQEKKKVQQEEQEMRRQEEEARRIRQIENQKNRPDNIDRFMRYAKELDISMDGGITASALKGYTPEKLKEALKIPYRKMILKAHPDQGGSKELFQELQNCYEALTE